MSRRFASRPVLLGGLFLLAVLASAVVVVSRMGSGDGTTLLGGSEYVEGVTGTWQRINPLYAGLNETDQDLSALIFAGLVRLGPDGTPRPDMAALPTISTDGLTYTFRLRRGLTWHDGLPVSARDVVFTVGRIREPDFRGDPALVAAWQDIKVTAPDDLTVVFELQQASAPFLARNATLGILPEHLLRGRSAVELFDAPFNTAPVGSGPFVLTAIDSRRASLSANDNYHLGRPSIDRFVVRFFTDEASALRAAGDREIDGLLVRNADRGGGPAAQVQQRGFVAVPMQRSAALVLYLNNDQAVFFDDARVRRAISLTLDRAALLAAPPVQQANAASSPIVPGTWAYAADYDVVAANVQLARSLLADAGWVASPTTGILVKDGEEFRFTIRTDSDAGRLAVAAEIKRQLEPLGIRATVAATPSFFVLRRDFLETRNYDVALATWDQGPDPDPYFGWHSSQVGSGGQNLANFSDLVADQLIAKGRTTTDMEVRRDMYRQFQETWQQNSPSVVVAYPRYMYLHHSRLDAGDLAATILFSPAQRFASVHTWKF